MHINGNNGSLSPRPDEAAPSTHSSLVYETFRRLQIIRKSGSIIVDGRSLDISSVVAVTRCQSSLTFICSEH